MSKVRAIGDIEVKPLAVFRGLTIEDQDFSEWTFEGVTFVDCVIRNCKFRGSKLSGFEQVSELAETEVIDDWESQRKEWKNQLYGIDGPSPWRPNASGSIEANIDLPVPASLRSAEDTDDEVEREMIRVRDLRQQLGIDSTATNPDEDHWGIETVFFQCRIESCVLDGANLYGTYVSACKIESSYFREADFNFSFITDSTVVETDCSGADLQSADLFRGQWVRTSFKGSFLVEARIHQSSFENCSFEETSLEEAEFVETTLADCDFLNSEFEQIFVSDLKLVGTTNLKLDNVEEVKSIE